MKALVALLALALLLAGCAHRPGTGSIADSATTYVALSSGDFVEANPVVGWSGDPLITALTVLGLKQGVKYGLTATGVEHCQSHRYVETGGWLGGGWNLAVLLGAGPPGAIAAGLVTATTYYQLTAQEAVFSCREAR